MKRLVLMLILLICSAPAAHGQQPPNNGSPCPSGMIPGEGGCFSPTDDSRSGQGSSTSAYTGPLWQDRYGAIAESESTVAAGVAQNLSSKRAARKAALQDCGKSDCKIKLEVRNSCLATAWGGGVSGYATKTDLRAAEAVAIDSCVGNGGSDCKVQYSACSLPLRVR